MSGDTLKFLLIAGVGLAIPGPLSAGERPNVPPPNTPAPTELALPFRLYDMDFSRKMISPFGLIRHSQDSGIGHGGIDIPLNPGDPLMAVSDGTILTNKPATDGRGGFNVELLLEDGDRGGEAWVFLYEHVELEPGIGVGAWVERGQPIGKSAIRQGSNHLGLIYLFNNFRYSKDHRCWVDNLSKDNRDRFVERFNKLKTRRYFTDPWRNAHQEGMYTYRGALDVEVFPDGPRPCYPLDTDVRVRVD